MRHKERCPITAKLQLPLQLKRANTLLGTANHVPSNEPLAERYVAVLEYRADRHRELAVAFGATVQADADFLRRVGLDFPEALLVAVLAVRADRAFRPEDGFNVFAGGFVAGEMGVDLVERQVFWRWHQVLCFHAPNIPCHPTLVKWLLFFFFVFILLIINALHIIIFAD